MQRVGRWIGFAAVVVVASAAAALPEAAWAAVQVGSVFPSGIVLGEGRTAGCGSASSVGTLRYNGTLGVIEACRQSGSWGAIGAGEDVSVATMEAIQSVVFCNSGGHYVWDDDASESTGRPVWTCECYQDEARGHYAGLFCGHCASQWERDTDTGRCTMRQSPTPSPSATSASTVTSTSTPSPTPTRTTAHPDWLCVHFPPVGNLVFVRRVGWSFGSWGPWTDNAAGTATYGTYVQDAAAASTFTKPYSHLQYSTMVFAAGDFSHWVHVSRTEVARVAVDCGTPFQVLQSSLHASPHAVAWCSRAGNPEDPWISERDHNYAGSSAEDGPDHSMLYGEASFVGWSYYREKNGGANVFVLDSSICPPL